MRGHSAICVVCFLANLALSPAVSQDAANSISHPTIISVSLARMSADAPRNSAFSQNDVQAALHEFRYQEACQQQRHPQDWEPVAQVKLDDVIDQGKQQKP